MTEELDAHKLYANQLATQMRKGFLVYCVLLLCKSGTQYTTDVIQRLREEHLVVVEGTIYPLLSRLQKDGMLSHEWKESVKGPPRKYYRITDDGLKLLEELQQTAADLQRTITNIEKV